MSSRLLSVTVVQATLESEATVACTVKLLDLALREIGKKEVGRAPGTGAQRQRMRGQLREANVPFR